MNTAETAGSAVISDAGMPEQVSELALLKQRARAMGIQVPNNISVETLKQRIENKMNGFTEESTIQTGVVTSAANDPIAAAAAIHAANKAKPIEQRVKSLREHLHETQMKLVRVRIQCMDPKKADLKGEIITFANEYLGTVRCFVPYGEQTDEGWHLPQCIYQILKDRQFLQISTKKDPRTRRDVVSTRYVKEYALDLLPALTKDELAALAAAQTASGHKIDE